MKVPLWVLVEGMVASFFVGARGVGYWNGASGQLQFG